MDVWPSPLENTTKKRKKTLLEIFPMTSVGFKNKLNKRSATIIKNDIYFYSPSFTTSGNNSATYNEDEDVNIAFVRDGQEAKIYVNGEHILSEYGWFSSYPESNNIRLGWGHEGEYS